MASSKSKRHAHKYHKVATTFGNVWACGLPDCNHHMPPHMEPLVAGKQSICWNCGETFILNPQNMRMTQPQCDDCLGPKVEDALSELEKRFVNNGSVS